MKSYQQLLQHVLDNGEDHDDRTGVGTRSVFGYQWRHSMADGFPLLTTKKVPLRWVAEELFWFLSGSTNEADLRERGVDIWQEWATAEQCARFGREAGDLGPIYGKQWRNFAGPDGEDQISNLLTDLTVSPNSRRLIVTGWHPGEQKQVALPPCHTLWQLKVHPNHERTVMGPAGHETVRGEGLSLHLYARSIDSFLGLPFNIASYALLLQLLSHATGKIPADLIISFGDLHIYKNHIPQVEEQLSRDPRHLPMIVIDDELKGGGLASVLQCKWENIRLYNYKPHPKIKADVAI